jgi:hypothetical protein
MNAPNNPHRLWTKKAILSALASATITVALAVGVCTFRGESVALGQSSPASVSTGLVAPAVSRCPVNLAQEK